MVIPSICIRDRISLGLQIDCEIIQASIQNAT